MMTGYGADEIRKDAELLGAAGVIQKPVELEALSKIIGGLNGTATSTERVHEAEDISR